MEINNTIEIFLMNYRIDRKKNTFFRILKKEGVDKRVVRALWIRIFTGLEIAIGIFVTSSESTFESTFNG